QTAGRGRLGRRWTAPAGSSLMTSILLRPPPSSPIAQLSLVAGLATAETVEQALDLSVQIKWPNDVMVDRRKVAGVLAEARDDVVVLGIGINVNQTAGELPADARLPVASLRTVDGVVRERAPLLADLIVRLARLPARPPRARGRGGGRRGRARPPRPAARGRPPRRVGGGAARPLTAAA